MSLSTSVAGEAGLTPIDRQIHHSIMNAKEASPLTFNHQQRDAPPTTTDA
jgi:hypothetical protein